MEIIEDIIKGIIAGILAAFLILYGLRPSVPYPEIILEIFDNKWMFLILVILNYYAFIWDYTIGSLLLLCVITLIFDYIIFIEKGFKPTDFTKNNTIEKFITNEPVFIKNNTLIMNDNIYDRMINEINSSNIIPGNPAPFISLKNI
jgi:hypothetical protein